MKEGRSLQALAMELERQRTAKQDFLVRPGNMSLVPAAICPYMGWPTPLPGKPRMWPAMTALRSWRLQGTKSS